MFLDSSSIIVKVSLSKVFPSLALLSLFLLLLLWAVNQSYALDVEFKWDASPDADHYEVYWGTSSGNYPNSDTTSDTTYNLTLPDATYYFAVKAIGNRGLKSDYSREVCVLGPNDIEAGYDRGWGITTGDLAGFKVMYDINDATPTLGPSSDLPPIPDVNAVGVPLNLQPSPVPPFATPMKIFIPCPGCSDVSRLDIYYYDGANWFLANDADAPDIVQPDAVGWMVPNSREDDNTSTPPTIAIRVVHFSGVQAGIPSDSIAVLTGAEGAGGCFMDTLLPPSYR